jgi:hypothetical protein
MLIGVSLVMGNYVAADAAAFKGIPFILNAVDVYLPNINYVNIIQYFDATGLLSSKPNVRFNRTVFQYTFDSSQEDIIINLFYSKLSDSLTKPLNGLILLNVEFW